MSFIAVTAKVGQSLGNGRYNVSAQPADDPTGAIGSAQTLEDAVTAAEVDVAAAVAVLVADGASPTQAHVTDLDTAHTTLADAIAAMSTAGASAALAADVTLVYKDTITERNQLLEAVRAIMVTTGSNGSLIS